MTNIRYSSFYDGNGTDDVVVQVHRGVRGLVKDSAGEPVEGATVIVSQVWHIMIIMML